MNKDKYPIQFELGGVTWKIELDNKSLDNINIYKNYNPTLSRIRIQDETNKEPRTYDAVMQTLWHEIIHAIMDTMGEKDLYKNEKFTDLLSTLVYQVIKTMKYD